MPLTIRPSILAMKPYSPGKPIDEVKRELGLTDVVKLASNENAWGPSQKAIEAAQKAAAEMHLYPDAACHDLKQALAAHLGVGTENLMLGNGSDELIHHFGQVMLDEPGSRLVMGDPSFVRYAASAELRECELVKVPLTSDWRHDVKAMAAACTPQTRLVYVANPNNPTGTMITASDVDLLLEALPAQALLVMDEAYNEFAAHEPDYPRSLDLIRAGRPVAVMRTFSKAYGLAGIRLGYGVASPELVDAVNRIREPFNVNSLAQAAAIAALGDQEHVRRTIAANRAGLDRVTAEAQALGFDVVPSWANFICIDLRRPAQPVFEALLQRGVIVRSGHVLGMPHHLRVSVGTEAEMDRFIAAFRESVA